MSVDSSKSAQRGEQLVEAEYADMKHAQDALNALEWAGVDAANITLAGPATEDASSREDTLDRDMNVTKSVVKHVGVGAVGGAIIGGAIGGIVGVIAGLAFGTGEGTWFTVGVGILLGAIICWHAGGFIGGETAMNINEAAELKFDNDTKRQVPATVQVSVDGDKSATRAETILRAKGPVRITRRGASATRMPPGRPA